MFLEIQEKKASVRPSVSLTPGRSINISFIRRNTLKLDTHINHAGGHLFGFVFFFTFPSTLKVRGTH